MSLPDGQRRRDGYGDDAVWRIAAPMILSAATTPLLGMVDTAVVGHLDEPWYLGAVAAGTTIFTVLFMGLNFLRMGTTGLTAQAFGAGEGVAVRDALGRALLTAAALAVALIALQSLIIEAALGALGAGAQVSAFTREYFAVRIWSAPASLANFVVVGWLLGMQNARGPLTLTLATNFTNIVLDLVFVLLMGLRVRGVAFATVLAELVGLVVGLAFVRAELAALPGSWRPSALLDIGRYRRLFVISSNLLLRTLSLMLVFAFITAQGARMGDVILAANALLMNFQHLLSYALDGIAHAAEALTGKAVGERNVAGLVATVRRSLRWSVGLALVFTLAYAAGGGALIDVLTGIPEVRAAARAYLPWLVLSPLVSVWPFLYDGVFVGATRPREMRLVMMAAAFLVFLPTWYLARDLGNHALWLAFVLFMSARGLGMHLWFRRLLTRGAIP
ncbi:MAG: MATE family efflux transporter [Gammaproteobacteria bacterium]|nr:MATE family efflux transporter [Gammaproteobacteria bacterium]